jgi:hypothetical protein
MTSDVTVVGWTFYGDEARSENDFGGMGGWVDGHDFDQYVSGISDVMRPYALALRDAIVRSGRKTTGCEHQTRQDGVPVFSDGTVSTFSYRAWGDIMAAVWNSAENTQRYSYMSFYM